MLGGGEAALFGDRRESLFGLAQQAARPVKAHPPQRDGDAFGFRDALGAKDAGGVYTNVTLCAYNGNGADGGDYVDSTLELDPSHWYRFVATMQLDDGASSIAVYDLGTEHPTIETATPQASVATFEALAFRRAPAALGGVSTIGLSAMGTMDNTIDRRAGVFWDNIIIDHRNGGLLIILK